MLVGLVFASALYLAGLFAVPWTRPLWLAFNSYRPKHRWGFLLPAANTLYVAFMATMGFAAVSWFLDRQGMATLSPQRVLEDPINDCSWYYLRSLPNATPVVELGWELPFQFTDPANRVLLLLYKISVVGPALAVQPNAASARITSRYIQRRIIRGPFRLGG